MVNAEKLERRLFPCPEAGAGDRAAFPEVSEEVFAAMVSDWQEDPSVLRAFPIIRQPHCRSPFVELYVWDALSYPDPCRRFVIAGGFRMPEAEEEDFLACVRGPLYSPPEETERFVRCVRAVFGSWHVPETRVSEIGAVMEHIYFAGHRSGPREILYKAGLESFARELGKLPSYNLLGTSPEEILGMPLRLLRILDGPGVGERLREPKTAPLCREVYRAYGGFLRGRKVTRAQWRYLEELYRHNGRFEGEGFSRALYDRLAETDDTGAVEEYRTFLRLRADWPLTRKMKLPSYANLDAVTVMLHRIRHCRAGIPELDRAFERRFRNNAYEYASGTYAVVMPASPADLCREAVLQGNCVMNYVQDHADADTTILFLRRASAPDRPFVTMEVSEYRIRQVYARFNRLPDREVYRFLEEYARKRWLLYDPYDLIEEGAEVTEEEVPDELWDYVDEYMARTRRQHPDRPEEEEEPGAVQLTMEGLYPEIFAQGPCPDACS